MIFVRLLCSAMVLVYFAHCKNDQAAKPVPEPTAPTELTEMDSLSPSSDTTKNVEDSKDVEEKAKDDMTDVADMTEISSKPSTSAPNKGIPAPPTKDKFSYNGNPKVKPSEGPPAQHGFADLAELDNRIRLDIRYATANNFTHSKIYDCPRCLLRPEAAAALADAHKALQRKGYGFKMFDCYRPRPYQQRLWDKVPNPDYVTPPAKGSMHSRGAAVDLTIVDAAGKELDMGTPYDFFGRAAHTDHQDLPAKVLENRKLLRETLEAYGFKGIRTEWWHFSYQAKDYPLSDYVWPCGEK
jgi:D-alanyl-D-alanine dipeptidase